MKHADYLHLVRLSEADAQESPAAYRRHVMAFVALGLLYVLLTLALAVAMLAGAAYLFRNSTRYYPMFMLGVGGITLLVLSFKSLRTPSYRPEGVRVTQAEAPELFRLLDKLRRKLKAPKVHEVLITDDFNAFITQRRKWGLIGPTHNTVGIGLPLALSVSAERLLAVLAHEYAHLRGQDGRSVAFVYRVRHAFAHLAAYVDDADNRDFYSALTTYFLRWYHPRFMAKTFALARQEEYTADGWAGKIYGRERVAHALTEIALLAPHITREHWRQYWQLASRQAKPEKGPYAWLASWNIKPPKADEIDESFAALKRERSLHDDTHPTTRDRVQALGQKLEMPPPSTRHAGKLLGVGLQKAVAVFDEAWWKSSARRWQVVHAQYNQERERIADLQARYQTLTVAELERLAELLKRQMRETDAELVYRRIREGDPHNASALWASITFLLGRNDSQALLPLAEMADRHPQYQRRAISLALELLDRQPYTPEVRDLKKLWQERLALYDEQDARYHEEIDASPLLAYTTPQKLTAYELEDLIASAQRVPSILKLWVLEKGTRQYSWRKAYLVVVLQNTSNAVDNDTIAAQLDLPGVSLVISLAHFEHELANYQSAQKPSLGAEVYNSGRQGLKLAV